MRSVSKLVVVVTNAESGVFRAKMGPAVSELMTVWASVAPSELEISPTVLCSLSEIRSATTRWPCSFMYWLTLGNSGKTCWSAYCS